MRILLVDDDLPTLDVLRNSIDWKSFGIHSIDTACNVAGAKAMMEANLPDIIICDVEMPKGSGIDLIKWVRENRYASQFIFLTCHENFEFASTAIAYEAAAYITKPFNSTRVEAAIAKAADKIVRENHLHEYSLYGKYWVDNKALVEQSFWRDILFHNISPDANLIQGEMIKRHLSLDLENSYRLVLSSINKSQMEDASWDDSTFGYAFCNLASEVILGNLDFHRIYSYMRNDIFYNIAVIGRDIGTGDTREKCRELVRVCGEHLHCTVSCYISEKVHLESLAKTCDELEEMDRNNIIFKGRVIFQGEKPEYNTNEQYTLDITLFNTLFTEGAKLQVANTLKRELEKLSRENRLDSVTMHSIHQDFMQLVYSVLYRNEIQAHILFSDPTSQKLFKSSENSVFDMMKWAAYITEKTVDYMLEVKQSESVVEKAKRFIHKNYRQDIRREDVAASVFLTPDYLAKVFKAETGVYIKDYINEYRIGAARELLLQSNASISDIAVQSGFDNFSYFSTVFKKITGETPFVFRKMHKA